MSSNNTQSAVTYTSISSDSDRPSWGIPLMNIGEFSKIDPYEEVAQQRKIHPLSHVYVPDPIELDEHVHVHVPEPEHPEYHAPSNDDIQVEDDNKYLEEDPREDLSKEHEPKDDDEDPEEDLNKKHEPEDSDEAEPFEEDKTAALIDAFAARSSLFPLPPTSPAYDQAPLGHKTAMIHRRDDIPEEDMPPQRRFAFTAPPPGCDVAESSAVAAARAPRRTIARAADRAEDVGSVRTLQAFKRRMTTSIEETDRRDIRLEFNVVRGQRTAYEIELQEVHQAYLSSEAQNRALLARLETLETRISRMEWQHQSAEDLTVTQIMHIQQ
nr:hypothetical protein [Tanacetum cinerariifolium]